MTQSNLDLISQFFAAYAARDMDALRLALADDVRWEFPGRNPLSGTRTGIDSVVAFFDMMGAVMGPAHVQVEQLIMGANDRHVVEAQHMWTDRAGGSNLDHHWCVLWTFSDGKIVEGRHLAADQYAVDDFFNAAAS